MRRSFKPTALASAVAVFTAIGLAVTAAAGLAAFPGETGRIAFMSNRAGNFDIYTVKQNGQDAVQLTNDPAADQFPSWSADGSQIVFTSTRDGNAEIYVMNADGSDQRRVTYNTTLEENPVLSPDGTKIAFASTRDAPIACSPSGLTSSCIVWTEIYVMEPRGSHPRPYEVDINWDGDHHLSGGDHLGAEKVLASALDHLAVREV
jgi:dipeptidyl aminopeptidase/acylaminoacyl peptidase